MLKTWRAVRVLIIGALLIGPACSSSNNSDDDPNKNDEDVKGGGPGSSAGSAGKGRAGAPSSSKPEGGEGGEGGQAVACAGCASGFCLADGTCVDCLPRNDQCPSGQYCTDQYECAPGCKNDTTSCASGVCGKDHNCKHCIDDRECSGDFVCSGGECLAACDAKEEGKDSGCGGGLTCCTQRCSDLKVDSRNCGACGNSCAAGQFCGLTACAGSGEGGAGGVGGAESGSCVECHDTTLANLCSVAKVTVILDSSKNTSDGNRVPGRAVGAALRDHCLPMPQLAEAEQDSVEALNITTGRPVSDSSELLVVAGGPFFQNLVGYLESQKITPLYVHSTSEVTEFRKTATKEIVASLPTAGDHDSHDIFIIQFMRDPASGSLILNEQGFWLSGTVAGAYQLTHGLLPDLERQDKAWYAYEWTDLDGDKGPDLNEIELLDSGN
ncbi:MAG TPA: hypothetical protein VJV79_10050 [Polyangiaceae bacterium]|nr:hypothetical protein [Polyangiaceae bacterium]